MGGWVFKQGTQNLCLSKFLKCLAKNQHTPRKYCILWVDIVPSQQKLGIILENNFASLLWTFTTHTTIICSYAWSHDKTVHGLRTPYEVINQSNLKIWADVAEKICFCRSQKGNGSWHSAVQWRRFSSPGVRSPWNCV